MFGQNRDQLRLFYRQCWQKRRRQEPLQGLELLVAQVVEQHPEYHALLADEDALQRDFPVEDGQINPFLHMGMHITLAEQLNSDRPAGIRALQHRITLKTGDAHEAEHLMMDCLGQILWEAQRNGQAPDETAYLECMRRLT
jgi:hypothetical protein